MRKSVEHIVAQALGISSDEVRDDLEYGSIENWSSFAHASLMLQIESEYDANIDDDTMEELTSVRPLRIM